MIWERDYGVATTIDGIPLVTRGAADYQVNPTLAAGDVQISKNGAAFANLATLPSVTPAGETSVQIALSAAEMQAARVVVRFVDQTNPKEWEDQTVIIETTGNVSAQHRSIRGVAIANQVWDALRAGHVGGNSFGQGVLVQALNTTAKADVNAEVAAALNTAVPGSPTANSINERIKAIDDKLPTGSLVGNDTATAVRMANLDDLDATVSSRSTITTAQVNTECDTALADIKLNKLIAAAIVDIDVTDNSALAKLVAKGVTADYTSFDHTTDSLEAIRDRGDAAWGGGGGGGATAAAIADAIADELIAAHASVAGSLFEAINHILAEFLNRAVANHKTGQTTVYAADGTTPLHARKLVSGANVEEVEYQPVSV